MSEVIDGAPPEAADAPARRPWLPISLLAVAGAAAIAGGAVAIKVELDRDPTPRQVAAAAEREMADRWRIMDAGELFPARVESGKGGPDGRPGLTGVRVGIAPAATCSESFDRELAEVLLRHGCRTVLRATYVDGAGALATTLGIAVMPSAREAAGAETGFSAALGVHGVKERYGVRTVPFPGTVTAAFDDSLRQDFWFGSNATPYLFFRSSGWLTPRGPRVEQIVAGTFTFADAVLNRVTEGLTALTEPCARRGVEC